MKSQATLKFWKFYTCLPYNVQQQARKANQLWQTNPYHPSLHFKRVNDKEPIYSLRVNNNYRVLGFLEGDTVL